jgi:hypothetical protein
VCSSDLAAGEMVGEAGRAAGLTIFCSSWPGLSRPSTPCFSEYKKGVDARHKAGHDD